MINEIDPKIYNFKNLKLEDQLVVASQFKIFLLIRKEKENLKKKVIILPNGIDNFWIKNQRIYNQNLRKKIRIIQVGNIDKNKNIVTTIKVCKKLIRKGYDIELKVIGRLYLSSKVLEENFIKYIPFCRKDELLEYYRNSDIFLEIKWTINDIQELLKANNCDYSDEAIENFFKNLDIDYMEEQCIEFGWDLLQSSIK